MGPGCLERNTRRYGLHKMPLCEGCAAALTGQVYKRELPESAARCVRRGASPADAHFKPHAYAATGPRPVRHSQPVNTGAHHAPSLAARLTASKTAPPG